MNLLNHSQERQLPKFDIQNPHILTGLKSLNQKGSIQLILLIGLIIIAGAVGFYLYTQNSFFGNVSNATLSKNPQVSPTSKSAGLKKFTNPKYLYEFDYPTDWNVDTSSFEYISFENKKPQESDPYVDQTADGQIYGSITLGELTVDEKKFYDPSNAYWSVSNVDTDLSECGPVFARESPQEVHLNSFRAMMQLSHPTCNYESSRVTEYTKTYFVPTRDQKSIVKISVTYDNSDPKSKEELKVFDRLLNSFILLPKIDQSDRSAYDNWSTFSNKNFDFTFKYPPLWEVIQEKDQLVLTSGKDPAFKSLVKIPIQIVNTSSMGVTYCASHLENSERCTKLSHEVSKLPVIIDWYSNMSQIASGPPIAEIQLSSTQTIIVTLTGVDEVTKQYFNLIVASFDKK